MRLLCGIVFLAAKLPCHGHSPFIFTIRRKISFGRLWDKKEASKNPGKSLSIHALQAVGTDEKVDIGRIKYREFTWLCQLEYFTIKING